VIGDGTSRRNFLKRAGAHALCLSSAPLFASAQSSRPDLLVGAHYYVWFPSNFQEAGYLRAKLRPAQQPQLGEYSSAAPATAEQHIAWASRYGVDFFTVDYWPGAPLQNARIEDGLLAARNIDQIRFCIFYELFGLGYDVATGFTVFDGPAVDRFVFDMEEIATRFFAHPSYLRVGGRPVVVIYVTRTATGRFGEAMLRARERLAALGFHPYLIGDEIFWTVAKEDGSEQTDEPQAGRIALFDAITAYNLYDSAHPSRVGYGATSTLLSDSRALYARYAAAAAGRPVIPLAFPGYNDRAMRLEANHGAVPREWRRGAGEASFFARWLDAFTLPLVDPVLPMLLVTSWNEWNEDTAIEPTAPAAGTASDVSGAGNAYTQGFTYAGFGMRYLEVLGEKLGRWSAAVRR
jgi:glycoprotein endo-alpha-1,2-mannosidase